MQENEQHRIIRKKKLSGVRNKASNYYLMSRLKPYPYGRCETFTYTLPSVGVPYEEMVIWDRDIEFWNGGNDQPSGVYIWHENQHDQNTPIYVGQSDGLFTRIYQHCHCPNPRNKKEKKKSVVWQFMIERANDRFEPCHRYPHECDCLLRYNVRLFVLQGDSSKIELDFIKCLRPILNKANNPIYNRLSIGGTDV